MPDFSKVERGEPLVGARAISTELFGTPARWKAVYVLPRDELGIVELANQLVAFRGWLNHALPGRVGKRVRRFRSERPHRRPASERAEAAVKANPDKSNRAIAKEIGVSHTTVQKVRKSTGTTVPVGKRVGKDGKAASVRKRRRRHRRAASAGGAPAAQAAPS